MALYAFALRLTFFIQGSERHALPFVQRDDGTIPAGSYPATVLYILKDTAYAMDDGLLSFEGDVLIFNGQQADLRIPARRAKRVAPQLCVTKSMYGLADVRNADPDESGDAIQVSDVQIVFDFHQQFKPSQMLNEWAKAPRGDDASLLLPPRLAQPSPLWRRAPHLATIPVITSTLMFIAVGLGLPSAPETLALRWIALVGAFLVLGSLYLTALTEQRALRNTLRRLKHHQIPIQPATEEIRELESVAATSLSDDRPPHPTP